jgi:uncharacterized protein (TIGR02145 family)
MKKLTTYFLLFFICTNAFAQNVGIGTNTPDSSALLELRSNSSGFLPPRLTTPQRNAINHPAEGLQIFNTTTHCLEMFVYGRWQNVFCGVADTSVATDTTAVIDIDGNSYPTVNICNQTWMAKNLDVSRYRNGDIIPQVTDPTQWANLTTGAWCWYNNDSTTYGSVYGRLYNWYAVNDPRGLAPAGWHVPSDGEWTTLTDCLGGANFAGGKIKEEGTTHWISPNLGATNSSGFTALPGGARYNWGPFNNVLNTGYFWSCSDFSTLNAWLRELNTGTSAIGQPNNDKHSGLSIRCVKDTPITTVNNGLVAYYPFNGNANDESGSGNNGTVNGATLTTDRFGNSGKAYSFDGVDDKVQINPSTSLNNFNNSMSISAWINCQGRSGNPSYSPNESQDLQGIFGPATYLIGDGGFYLRLNDGNYDNSNDRVIQYVNTNAGVSLYSHSIVTNNIWEHIICTFDGNYVRMYRNGNMTDSILAVGGGISNSNNTNGRYYTIGQCIDWGTPSIVQAFNGKIDDIRIYNRALTQAEITYLATH